MMTTEDNEQIIRRLYTEVVSQGDFSLVGQLISPDYVDHNSGEAGRGPDVFRAHIEAIRTTFPDLKLEIEDLIAKNDKVVTRVKAWGTHRGHWMGIEPTGNPVSLKGINIDRIVEGKVAEHWGEADTVGMLVQMGCDPFAPRASR